MLFNSLYLKYIFVDKFFTHYDSHRAKTIYQATPCVSEINEQKVDIKIRNAKQEAAAVEALKKWEVKYNAQQAAEKAAIKAEKNKQPRNIIVQVIQRPAPQLGMRKPSRRRMMSLR